MKLFGGIKIADRERERERGGRRKEEVFLKKTRTFTPSKYKMFSALSL